MPPFHRPKIHVDNGCAEPSQTIQGKARLDGHRFEIDGTAMLESSLRESRFLLEVSRSLSEVFRMV